MFSEYVDLEIHISALSESRYAVSASGPGGDASGALVLPTHDPTYQALVGQLAALDTDEESLAELGQLLFGALFQGAIRDIYTRSQGTLGPDQGLRLRLNIAAGEAAAIALPWEFLHDPDQGPLALLDAPVMRYLPQSSRIPSLATELPLKVLLTGAQTPPHVDVERELTDIASALLELNEHVQITIEEHLTTSKLQKLLREGFHVWHFVGHGGFGKDGTTGRLFFEDASGDAEPVSALQLGILLNRSGLRLVVLDACEGGKLSTDPFRSMAPALIRAQVPAVVAMQFTVPQDAARAFATEFYRALAEGFPIDACATEGRKAVMNATGLRRPDWGIPVVYTRAHDGRLFELPGKNGRLGSAPIPPPPSPAEAPVFQRPESDSPGDAPQRGAGDARGETPHRRAGDAQSGPPLPERRAINLPATPTALVGRNQDVEAARMLLKRGNVRLLTLTGPGGTGKTRLAIQIATDLLDSFPYGVCFVDLAPIGQRDLVITTIAHTLGVKESGDQPLLAALKEYLSERKLLLVLDNFEQVLEAAPLLAELLAGAPRLEILVTSRAALRISGEYEFPVAPLALPNLKRLPPLDELAENPAVALFVERARAVKGSFALTNANAQSIAEICARLDGLPLAIELAAARTNVLTPQALLARLSNRLDLLTGGARDLTARQQTLRGAIAWSYDLLGAHERTLFARLAAFAGGCTLEAAERVCAHIADDEQVAIGKAKVTPGLPRVAVDVLDTIGSLVDKSLLRQVESQGETRFVMLETIREYAQLRLAAGGETQPLRRRHAAYYLELAERAEPELVGPNQVEWLERLEDEHDNMRAALGWALQAGEPGRALRMGGALVRFWWGRGYLSEGRGWLEQALTDFYITDSDMEAGEVKARKAIRAKGLNAAGVLAWAQGDYNQAQFYYTDCLSYFRTLGDHNGIARVLTNLGLVSQYLGDYVLAEKHYIESLNVRHELKDKLGLARTYNNLGLVAFHQQDYEKAHLYYMESLSLFQQLEDHLSIAILYGNLGGVALHQNNLSTGQKYYIDSLTLQRKLGNKREIAYCLEELATIAGMEKQIERAAQLWGAAESLRQIIGAPLPPSDKPAYDQAITTARAELDKAAWETAWSAGREMTLEQAIELAMAT